MANKRSSKKHKGLGFHNLEIKNITTSSIKKTRKGVNPIPKITGFILDYPIVRKQLRLHPTKGYRLENA